MLEYVIEIDFIDCPGLGYKIFALTEEYSIDKISMEVLPGCGMVIKFRCKEEEQVEAFIQALKLLKGIQQVRFRQQMPHEEREWELKAILNSVSEGVMAVDANGCITHMNEVACQLFLCTSEEVLGLPAEALLENQPPILDTLKTGKLYKLQERRIQRKGSYVHFLTSCVPVKNNKGQIIGAVSTIKDFQQVKTMLASVEKRRRWSGFEAIAHASPLMARLIQAARTVAKSSSSILLRGESGTGKELFATAIHTEGPRYQKPFIAVNCTALPDTLLESELFGYEEGAFTGALKSGKKGLFEQAHGGTLFLDEIGDISSQVQVSLLRVLQSGTIRRVGGHKEIQVDVRIIAATHRNLEDMLKTGEFREDLYYRLNVIPLTIPPLRERREDIPLVAQHLIRKICARMEREEIRLSREAAQRLMEQDWPGNVRQLENMLERVINFTEEKEILPEHLLGWADFTAKKTTANHCLVSLPETDWPPLRDIVAQVEKQVLQQVLEKHPSSRAAARVLGVSNTTILNKRKEYEI